MAKGGARTKRTDNDPLTLIKRINQRLTVYENSGMENSRMYELILEKARTIGLEMTTSKKGTPRISRSKSNISPSNISKISSIESLGGLQQEISKTRKRLKNAKEVQYNTQMEEYKAGKRLSKPTKPKASSISDTVGYMKAQNNLRKFIDENKEEWYILAKNGETEEIRDRAQDLVDMLQQGQTRHTAEIVIRSMANDLDIAREKIKGKDGANVTDNIEFAPTPFETFDDDDPNDLIK